MDIEHDQFIGIYRGCVPIEVCNELASFFWEMSKHNVTMSSRLDGPGQGNTGLEMSRRKDEVVHIPAGISSDCFNQVQFQPMWEPMMEALKFYIDEYSIDFGLDSENWKMHCARPRGGYHVWHHEQAPGVMSSRVLAWMIILEAPEEGGETEFLLQSRRIAPVVGNCLIWPAYFTHRHRGNPPLKGHKLYATGWFVQTGPG